MNKCDMVLTDMRHHDLRLRSADHNDIENLRQWKNRNKRSFFLQKDISPEDQERWFKEFISRKDDFMFMVEQRVGADWEAIGCMGFRLLENEGFVDVYNIQRSKMIEPSPFSMGDAFRLMLAYASDRYPDLPIRGKVLRNNAAVDWYRTNRAVIIDETPVYYLVEMENKSLKEVRLTINSKS